MKKLVLFFVLVLLAMPCVYAKQGHLKLLAVSETESGYNGSIADLYLEIKDGSGRVFIETYPLTKFDTQISTRFAKDIACDYLDIDCSNYDFFYTIKADTIIIGGPSAGAAIAALTVSLLDNSYLDKNIAVTGTINSGGIIGPVGGLKEKISTAAEDGIKSVMIPYGERFAKERNKTTDLVEYGTGIGIKVVEVSELDDVMYGFTGKNHSTTTAELYTDASYLSVMKSLAEMLCARSMDLRANINYLHNEITEKADNLTQQGGYAYRNQTYYSSASFCFGANIHFIYADLLSMNLTKSEINTRMGGTKEAIDAFNKKIDEKGYVSITDLEAYVIVKERLSEASDYLDLCVKQLNEGKLNSSLYSLAYANERIYSAESWGYFYGTNNVKIVLNKEAVKKSCTDKLAEAEERYNYVNLLFPDQLDETTDDIGTAKKYLKDGSYELCLFKASKAKADADAIINLLGVEEDQIDTLLSQKISVIRKIIIKKEQKGIFPILGYSYYEYADTLKDVDKYSALLYLEYALELSNIDLYFKEKQKPELKLPVDKNVIYALATGFFLGAIITLSVVNRKSGNVKTKRKKKTH